MATHIQGDAVSGNGWVIPSRWHIDDVKYLILDSEHENKPMPSNKELLDYLLRIIGSETWVQSMNEELWMNLDELFEEKD